MKHVDKWCRRWMCALACAAACLSGHGATSSPAFAAPKIIEYVYRGNPFNKPACDASRLTPSSCRSGTVNAYLALKNIPDTESFWISPGEEGKYIHSLVMESGGEVLSLRDHQEGKVNCVTASVGGGIHLERRAIDFWDLGCSLVERSFDGNISRERIVYHFLRSGWTNHCPEGCFFEISSSELFIEHPDPEDDTWSKIVGASIGVPNQWVRVSGLEAPIALDQRTWVHSELTVDVLLARGASGFPSRAEIVLPPRHGTVSLAGTRATYRPDPDFVGEDRFLFRLSNRTGPSKAAVVRVDVAPSIMTVAGKLAADSLSVHYGDVADAFDIAAIAADGPKRLAENAASAITQKLFTEFVAHDNKPLKSGIDFGAGLADFIGHAWRKFATTNPIAAMMKFDALLFRGIETVLLVVAHDPPDRDYKHVVELPRFRLPSSGDATLDRLAKPFARYVAALVAAVRAAEKWQGATLAGDLRWQRLHAEAYGKFWALAEERKRALQPALSGLVDRLPVVDLDKSRVDRAALSEAIASQCGKPLAPDVMKRLLAINGVTRERIEETVCAIARDWASKPHSADFGGRIRGGVME